MKKRALALILGMVMLLGILAGCGEPPKVCISHFL